MSSTDFKAEYQNVAKVNEFFSMVTLGFLNSFYHGEKGFEEACDSIVYLFDMIISHLQGESPLTIEEVTNQVDLIRRTTAIEKYEGLKKIGYYEAIKALHGIGIVTRVIDRITKLNTLSEIKVDYRWFFPELDVEDIDTISRIVPQIHECIFDVTWMEKGLIDKIDSLEDAWAEIENNDLLSQSPLSLYKSLIGSGNSKITVAETYFDLWFEQDFDKLIETITWGLDIHLPNLLDKPMVDNQTNSKHQRRMNYLEYHNSRLMDIRIDLVKLNGDDTLNFHRELALMRVAFIEEILSYLLYKAPLEIKREEERIQLVERNRILSNLSHSIKNMLKAVIDPLVNLREEIPQKAIIIDNAIKGANLIRQIVNAINLSFETTLEELKWDVVNPGKESMTLHDMVIDSLKSSISNMFDFRYFPAFAGNYYPRSLKKAEYQGIKDKWDTISPTSSLSLISEFAAESMFDLRVELSDVLEYRLGNEKSSAIKLMILFQEIIFNAVKYASFVARKDRFIDIRLIDHGHTLSLEVSNSYRPEIQAKTTGVGKVVIENFAKVLDCQPDITTTDKEYKIKLEFKNIWRNDAQDSLH